MLPTYQRHINGIPLTQGRRTLRIREKYIVLLVFVTFGTVCFGAFFFLPDLRDRVSVDGIRRELVDGVFFPEPAEKTGVFRHDPGEDFDDHQIKDRERFNLRLEHERKQQEILENVRRRLNMTAEEHKPIKAAINDDKQRILERQKSEEARKRSEAEKEALQETKDHEGVHGGQGGEPEDEVTKKRRDKIRQVSSKRAVQSGERARLGLSRLKT